MATFLYPAFLTYPQRFPFPPQENLVIYTEHFLPVGQYCLQEGKFDPELSGIVCEGGLIHLGMNNI